MTLAWDARVPGPERTAWEARAKAEGFPKFGFTEEKSEGVIVPAGPRDEYFPVFYVESLTKDAPAFGFDVGSEPRRRAAMEQAWTTGHPPPPSPSASLRNPDRSAASSFSIRYTVDPPPLRRNGATPCAASPPPSSASAIWWSCPSPLWAKTGAP